MTELTVIPGDGEDAGPPLCTKGPVTRSHCGHKRVELDAKERTVTCLECKALRDPFDALLTIEANLSRYRDWGARYKREATQAAAELEDLKRQVRNVKAQLSRAKGKR